MTNARKEGGAAAVAPPTDTFTRIRAVCTGAPNIDLDKHAAQITEVVAVAKLRPAGFFDRDDEVPAPERP